MNKKQAFKKVDDLNKELGNNWDIEITKKCKMVVITTDKIFTSVPINSFTKDFSFSSVSISNNRLKIIMFYK